MAVSQQDPASFDAFQKLAGRSRYNADPADAVQLETLEWNRSDSMGPNTATNDAARPVFATVSEISKNDQPSVRVIFAPCDDPDVHNLNALLALFRLYDVPDHFLYERVQSVTHSFGFENIVGGGYRSWFHFLCKSITYDHGNPFWTKSGYYLRTDGTSNVTLICFGASDALTMHFKSLADCAWQNIFRDPLLLYPIILSDLHETMDEQVWESINPIRELEANTFGARAESYTPNFVDLHNVAKNIIHLKEASDAILRTVGRILQQAHGTPVSTRDAMLALQYRETLFESINLRLISMEKRIQNIINLSFNLVALRNSKIALRDSNSMHILSLAAFTFLPLSTVAAIFGSEFFKLDVNPDSGGKLIESFYVSSKFWIFWTVSIPLTVAVLAFWLIQRRRAPSKYSLEPEGLAVFKSDLR